ncbi:hypothetical protein CZ774_16020 [Frigoribacterium sp. JB110]|nr:hypothetical protein CZ774_16020 [Frigoribacterium sp. JB110]
MRRFCRGLVEEVRISRVIRMDRIAAVCGQMMPRTDRRE